MGFDIKDFNQSVANTARVVHELNLQMEEENRRKAEKENKLLAGAEANIEQKTLLEEQLQIMSEQNGLHVNWDLKEDNILGECFWTTHFSTVQIY